MATATERLLVRIDATTEQLRREMKRAEKATESTSDKIARSLTKVGKAIGNATVMAAKWGAAAAAAGAAVTAALVKSGLKSADALAKQADKLGVTTESLAGLRFAAQQTGVATKQLDVGLQRFTRRLADAAAGAGPAVKAFEALGLSATELVKLSPDEALGKVADELNKVGNQSEKVAIAFKLFDSEGVGLVNTLRMGSEGLAEMAQEAEILGLTLNRVDAAKIEKANDAMARIGSAFSGLSQQLAAQMAPVLEAVANRIFAIIKNLGGMGNVAQKVISSMIGWLTSLVRSFNAVEYAVKNTAENIAAAFGGIAANDIGRMEKKLRQLNEELAFYVKNGSGASKGVAKLKKEIAELEKRLAKGRDLVKDFGEETTEADNSVEEFLVTLQNATSDLEDFSLATVSGGESLQEIEVTAQRVAAKTFPALSNASTTAAREVEIAWDKALQGTAERIDSAFASAWKGAFDSFSQFSDAMKDAFQNLLAELAHMAITRPILISIGTALGFGSAGASASGLGGGGMPGIPGISSLANLGNSAFMHNASVGISNTGFALGATSAQKAQLYGGLATGAAGFGGSYLASQMFEGEYVGLGSMAGGAAGGLAGASLIGGAFGGPIGAAAGALLGGAAGSLFGGKNNGDQRGRATLDLSTGEIVGSGVGKSFEQANIDSAQQVAAALNQFAQLIGGSTGNFDIQVGNKSGLILNEERFGKDEAAFFKAAFAEIIKGADNLSDELKILLENFDGTKEEITEFAVGVASIGKLMKDNPLDMAVKTFAQSMTLSGKNLTEIFQEQLKSISELTDSFDGSIKSVTELNELMVENSKVAYDLGVALRTVQVEVSTTVQDQVEYFRSSVRTPDEQLRVAEQRFATLFAQLPGMTDPNEISATSQQLLALNKQIFDAGPDDLKRSNNQVFVDAAREIRAATREALAASEASLSADVEARNNAVQASISSAAAGFQAPADKMNEAADKFVAAVDRLLQNDTGRLEVVA